MINDFINMLSQNDRFTLITFSSETTQSFALQPVTSSIKNQMKNSIKPNNYWGWSTNLKEGQILGRTMYFILVTDGNADKGHEGIDELKEILSITNIVVKICSFGQNIDSHILTDVLGNKIQDYVHLVGIDDFNKMVKSVGLERLAVIADNITLEINDQLLTLRNLELEMKFYFHSL